MAVTQIELTVFFAMESFLGLFSGKAERGNFGGAEIKMAALARSLARTGRVKVVLLTEGEPFDVTEANILVRKIELPVKRGVPGLSRVVNDNRVQRTFSYDTEHAVFMASQVEKIFLFDYARKKGVTSVYRINANSLVDKSPLVTPEWHKFVFERVNAADEIMTQNEYQQEQLLKNYGIQSTIMDGLHDTEELKVFPDQDGTVLWVGRCVAIKRPWIFVELAKALPEYQFVMVTPHENANLSGAILAESELVSNLHVIDYVPREEMLQYYARSNMVVSTSWSEGMPSTLLEASFSKRPYISFMLEFDASIKRSGFVINAHNDFQTLVNEVRLLQTDESLRKEYGEKAYAYAQDRWSEEKIVNDHIEYFLRISKRGGAHGTQN